MALPRHVAIIMDGNGRWARKRNLPKIMGHRSGAKAVDTIIEACSRLGIKALTLYAFSTENWKRPKEEIDALMGLLKDMLRQNLDKIMKNNMRFNVIGRIDELLPSLRDMIKTAEEESSANTGMTLTLAINYGGRQEILDAARKIYASGKDISSLREEDFGKYLYTGDLPDPDLIIRTSGEMRLSNFLLWQAAYSELYVTDTLWPDFGKEELEKAIKEYEKRERRFGE
jgi:undecaprenyl diphosphate synthase